MNLAIFTSRFNHLKDIDPIPVDDLCDHQQHVSNGVQIKRGAARRNILKNGGQEFICRACCMRYRNPVNQAGPARQTDEEITVTCPKCNRDRSMKKTCYYGSMIGPYWQVCGSCVQRGKVLPGEQRARISDALKGRKLTKSHRRNIGKAVLSDPDRLATASRNLQPGVGGGWNKGKSTPQNVRDKISAGNKGRRRTGKQRKNISKGRIRWLNNKTAGFACPTRSSPLLNQGLWPKFE